MILLIVVPFIWVYQPRETYLPSFICLDLVNAASFKSSINFEKIGINPTHQIPQGASLPCLPENCVHYIFIVFGH